MEGGRVDIEFVHLLVLICCLWNYSNQVEEILRFVSKETVEITDKSVDVSLAGSFVNDVLVVVIPQTTGEFLIVHLWFIFPRSPPPGDLVRVRHLELPAVSGP